MKRGLTLTEWGVIVAMCCSIGTGLFSLGVYYNQVTNNTLSVAKNTARLDRVETGISAINANVAFLTELAREQRAREERRGNTP